MSATRCKHGFLTPDPASRCSCATEENERLIAENAALRAVIARNHRWHQDYDEFDGYSESDLGEANSAAIAHPTGRVLDLLRADFVVKNLDRSVRDCNSGEWVRLDDKSWAKLQRQAAKQYHDTPRTS